MPILDRARSVLVAVDFQGKLTDQVSRPVLVRQAAVRLLRIAQLFEVPVVMTEQYPKGIGPTHPDILAEFERLTVPKRRVEKTSFGCCGEPSFERALAELRPAVDLADRQIVLCGIEAHVCVMQTALALLDQGSEVHLCWEAISGRGEEYRRHALERMAAAGAVLTNHESVGFEWARHKDHPQFKAFSALLKEGQLTG